MGRWAPAVHDAADLSTEAARAAYAMGHNADNLKVASSHTGLGDRMANNPDNTDARFRHLLDPFTANITVQSQLKDRYSAVKRQEPTDGSSHFWVRPLTTGAFVESSNWR